MGKPKGDAARSKARPSSSSLAASLLPSGSAAATVGFGGYVGSSRFETSIANEDSAPFLDLDSEVAQHLQRLSRKDPTTKIKALASLSELIKQKKGKELLPLIPQWTFEYKKLILDYNRDVRRATHDVMTNVVTGVGRDLAPHLKSIMGPWWFSQFDLASEVSQAAKSSLQAAFPAQEKRLDALNLCSAEIFAYLEENLKLTPQNLSDKALAKDELEEMYQQMISSSLVALATLLDILLHEPDKAGSANINPESKLSAKARKIAASSAANSFSSHKCFLNFLKSESASIRSATYSLLSRFIKNVPEVFGEGDIKCLAPALLGVFRENNSTCHSSMWEAVLLFSRKFPQSWSYLNVHKSVLNHLWEFLRNGCFGSARVSYPALILFLEVMPPKSVEANKFFVNFFKNLFAGRSMCDSSRTDQLSLLRATTECFLWGLHNASRYCDGPDTIHVLQVDLIDKVLVKILWADFFEPSKGSTPPMQRKSAENLSMVNSTSYQHELGRCIIEVLSGINLLDQNLLSVFCNSVQQSFLNMLEQGNFEIVRDSMRKMVDFLWLLERNSVLKGESWPLNQFMGPLLSKSFPWIKSSEVIDGLKLLSVSVSVFGPRKIVPVLIGDVEDVTLQSAEKGRDISSEKLIKVFQEKFIPWCMDGYDSLTGARQDLLLSLLDDLCFTQQWSDVISYVFNQQQQDFSNLTGMEMLLEKSRDEIKKRSSEQESNRIGSQPDHWHHRLIESTCLSLARSSPTTTTSTAQFLCSVLGGSTEDRDTSFVSRSSLVLIYRGILEKLLPFIKQSTLYSINGECCSLIVEAIDIELDLSSSVDVIMAAKFAAEVIDGSLFSLKALNQDPTLLSSLLSSIFLIDLESRLASLVDTTLYEFREGRKDPNLVCDFVHSICSRVKNQFCKSINYDARKSLASILVQSIRSVVLLENNLQPSQLTLLCASWIAEVLGYLSLDQSDEESISCLLLAEGDVWPMWVSPCSSPSITTYGVREQRKSKCQRFVSLINNMVMKMGIHRFLVCHEDNGFTSQAWLPAEILCTWEWPGGNVQTSFLPTLVSFCQSEPLSGVLLDSIFDILLNGALIHGEDEIESSRTMWLDFNNHIEDIEEPFLRALVSFLSTLFKEGIWKEEEAMSAFKILTDKLFIGEETSRNCLRIFPFIMSIIVLPLRKERKSDVSGKDTPLLLEVLLRGWLERCLSFPPLVLWHSGEDMQDWCQLVISCYPVTEKAEEAKELQRQVSSEERRLLLELFRKQKQVPGASSSATQDPAIQVLFARLIVVAVTYCGNDFNEQDWDFVFSNLKRLIQSAVVVMEETSENVNDFMSGVSSTEKEDDTLEGLGHIVSVSDPSIANAKNALSAFSLLNALVKHKSVEGEDSLNSLTDETWEPVKDRILEGVLRLFFCTGLAESIAASYSQEAASIVASFRLDHLQFWELVAQLVVESSPRARDRAVRAVEFWGLSKGAISSLYAIMFSSNPIPSLQLAAYVVLSTEPISRLAIIADGNVSTSDESLNEQDSSSVAGLPSEDKLKLRDEISWMVEKLSIELLETELTAPERVQTFLAWSLLLSHVNSLPTLTQERERLVQYIEKTANSLILDSLFQHIPLESYMAQSLKKKDSETPLELSLVASAATHAITTGSSLSTVESLWPIETGSMACLAGGIYGLMLRVLPAYVREWFSEMRDRSASSSIEAFTRLWCSPSLIKNELSQIKKADFNDESFSVSISKSANEVVATYTKDETEMDLMIRLPVSYPLRPVDVNCAKSIGISDAKQRKWLMSMLMFVRNQNGALAEAVRIWKRNSDKEFEGVEDCPICYSVIHTANHSLPKRACVTCKYKFHKACLDKWFLTSHKKVCPLCQSPC